MILQKTTITDLHANLLRLYRHERENSIGSRENDNDGVDINDRQRSNSYISYQETRPNKTSSKPSTISLPIIISLSGRLSRSSSKCQNITSPDEQEDQNQDTHSGRRSNDEQQQLTGRLTKTARGLLQTKGYNIKFSPTNERSTKFEPKDENKRNPQGFFRKSKHELYQMLY